MGRAWRRSPPRSALPSERIAPSRATADDLDLCILALTQEPGTDDGAHGEHRKGAEHGGRYACGARLEDAGRRRFGSYVGSAVGTAVGILNQNTVAQLPARGGAAHGVPRRCHRRGGRDWPPARAGAAAYPRSRGCRARRGAGGRASRGRSSSGYQTPAPGRRATRSRPGRATGSETSTTPWPA